MEAQSKNEPLQTPPADGTDGREALPKFWIAAYTRPRSEKKAGSELTKMGIENYVPLQSTIKQWSDRKKRVDTVVIPNIIFVKLAEDDIITLKQHSLIIRIIQCPGNRKYGIIPNSQIERLKYMLKEADAPVIFNPKSYTVADCVRVKRGHLMGLTGAVERISANKSRIIVSIDLLGGAMMEIETSDLEVL